MSNSLRPYGLQHTRLPCPSPTPGACSNLCPSIQWCHPTISSFVIPFSSCLQSFPASGSFPRSQFFTSGGQNIRVSASASVLPVSIQDWFPLGLTGLISLHQRALKSLLQQFSSVAQSCPTLCNTMNAAHEAFLSITNSQSLPKLMSIASVMPSNHLILCRPLLLLPSPPSFFSSSFSSIRVLSNESTLCIRWPKLLEFQFQHQSFQWTPRTDLI